MFWEVGVQNRQMRGSHCTEHSLGAKNLKGFIYWVFPVSTTGGKILCSLPSRVPMFQEGPAANSGVGGVESCAVSPDVQSPFPRALEARVLAGHGAPMQDCTCHLNALCPTNYPSVSVSGLIRKPVMLLITFHVEQEED